MSGREQHETVPTPSPGDIAVNAADSLIHGPVKRTETEGDL